MTLFIKNLSYKNTDEQIQKLLEILLDIPKYKQIKYKFEIESGLSKIAR